MASTPTPPTAATLPPPQDADAPSPPPDVQPPLPPAPNADAPPPSTDADAPKPDPPPPTQAHLPDGILEDILLRLPTAGDVARASAACASFRAITAALPFRRRFRALHRAPVLGFLREDFYAARAPHPSAPAARALKRAADFAISFLPDADCWSPRDARGGRVLFSAVPSSHGRGSFADATSTTFVDLVVADPLSRRFVRVPPVPDYLAAPVLRWGMLDFEPFLGPASAEDLRDVDARFRVIGKVLCEEKVPCSPSPRAPVSGAATAQPSCPTTLRRTRCMSGATKCRAASAGCWNGWRSCSCSTQARWNSPLSISLPAMTRGGSPFWRQARAGLGC